MGEDVQAGPGMTWEEAQAFLKKWEKKITDDLKNEAAELKIRCTGERLITFEKKLELYQSIIMPHIASIQRLKAEETEVMKDLNEAKYAIEKDSSTKTNVTEIQRVQGTLMAMGTKLRGVKIEQDKMAKEIQELRGSPSSLYGAEATAKSDNELKWELAEQQRLEEEEKVKQAEITK